MEAEECYYLDNFWPSKPPVPMTKSSFVPYTKPSFPFPPSENWSLIKRPHVHSRMIDFLRTIPTNRSSNYARDQGGQEFQRHRSYKHMINERLRRQKQRITYNALHSLLPPGTRNDTYTILQMAALNLLELKKLKESLHKRNQELENNVLTDTFRIQRQTPLSGIDSMIGVLTTMKNMGLKARSIHSEFSNTEFIAVLEIGPKTEAMMVENAIASALDELERKSTGWCISEGLT